MAKTFILGILVFFAQIPAVQAEHRGWYRVENGLNYFSYYGEVAKATYDILTGSEVTTGQAPVNAIATYRRGKQIQCFASPTGLYSCDLYFDHNGRVLAPRDAYDASGFAQSIPLGYQIGLRPEGSKPGIFWLTLTDNLIAPRIFLEALVGPDVEFDEIGPHGGIFVRKGADFRAFSTRYIGMQVDFEFDANGAFSY